jgi:hypothetical protein
MRLAGLCAAFSVAVSCFGLETNLLTPAELRTQVSLVSIARDASTPHFENKEADDGSHRFLQGTDKRSRTWKIDLPPVVREIWRDTGAGPSTYYLTGGTNWVGSAPHTWMLALSFDDRGSPVPFFATTHGSIQDLLNLDGKGPQLLLQDFVGDHWHNPGYYITTLYERRGHCWHRSDGRHGDHDFPAFERRFTNEQGKDAVLVARLPRVHSVSDLSNCPARKVQAYGNLSLQVVYINSLQNRKDKVVLRHK